MGTFHSTHGSQGGSSMMLSAAALIARLREGCPLEGSGIDVFSCYQTLLDIINDSNAASEICRLLNMPETKMRSYAEAIVDLLLFNKGNDPYMSLGLQGDASDEEVNRRWKSLIFLYHPDKYWNQRDYEERAKKINEAYERIHSARRQMTRPQHTAPVKEVKIRKRTGDEQIRHFKLLRHLPGIILAVAVMIAIISALMLIGSLRHP
jgi:hypothetical protein